VFDVDGTLYPASSLYMRCVDTFIAHPQIITAFSSVRKRLRILQMEDGYTPKNREDLHRLQSSLVAERLHIDQPYARELIEKIFYADLPKRFASIRPYPGVRDTIEKIRAQGIRVAALSDLPPEEKIDALGLSGVFERAFCTENSGVLKPHPQAFEGMARALGIGLPELLYVGNNPRYDIDGSKRVGMFAARRGKSCPGADFSFFQWRKLAEWVLSGTE